MAAGGTKGDRGETLLELIVALAIMSVAVVALVGGLGTSIMMSDIHRKQATAGMILRNYAEDVTAKVDTGGYPAACAPLDTAYTPPSGFSATVVSGSVRYWTASGWTSSCTTDTGLRQLKLQVASLDDRAVEKLVIEVRKPCGLADPPCA
jgi:prepilin-type N-terminal cleavage/methylation domain-containing protein